MWPLLSRSAPAADSSGISSGHANLTGCDSELQGMSVSGGAFLEPASSAAQTISSETSTGAARSGSDIPTIGPTRSTARPEPNSTSIEAAGT